MSITVLIFLFLGIFLVIFGVAFTLFGMSSEKAYWFQRDPQGNPIRVNQEENRRITIRVFPR